MKIGIYFFKIKLFLVRLLCYEKPLRVAFTKYLSLLFKTFRPHYESILYEACLEAKKLGINHVSALELGVAQGNGIVALEKYKKKIEKVLDIKIDIYGFDMGSGMPEIVIPEDLPFYWKQGQYKTDKELLARTVNSKIIYGNIKDTVDEFIKIKPKTISCIFFDMDLYSSTLDFLNQIPKLSEFLLPRVLCYFDDLYTVYNYNGQCNGELKAIDDFNKQDLDFKLSYSIDHIHSFKFPLAKSTILTIHSFKHKLYNKYIGREDDANISLKSKRYNFKLLE